jgi:integrase
VSFAALIAGWAAEKRPSEKTLYSWQRVFDRLASFVGHRDAARLSADDLIRWKAELIGAGLHPKTVRDGRIAPVKAILQWGVDNRRLPANPAERIGVDVRVKVAETIRSFTDEEARTILKAALQERHPVRRWVPWLCAYTGARVSEVCQLRTEDVVQVEGIWCLKLAPEAGSLKTHSSERAIPLHPAVIESGFLVFV